MLTPALTLQVGSGERWAVVGHNGAGKSCLLRTLLGLVPGRSGEAGSLRPAAYLPSRPSWPAHLPARVDDVVALGSGSGLSLCGSSRRRAKAARWALERLQLADLAGRSLHTLSEGQRQRVWLARALACRPLWLALDEPTGAMDATNERRLLGEVAELCCAFGMAAMCVGHHLSALLPWASHVVLLHRHPPLAFAGTLEAAHRQPAVLQQLVMLGHVQLAACHQGGPS